MYGSKERRGILCVTGSDATPAFEVKEGVLNGADREIAWADALAGKIAADASGKIVAAIHMAADLPLGSKGRVRSAFFDRNENEGSAELFAIFYDYGQTYGPGISGWNQFWRVNLGAWKLDPAKSYAVILNAYDPEARMTTLRITVHATDDHAETTASPEMTLANPSLAAQGVENRFSDKAFRFVKIPDETRGSTAINLGLYSNGEQCVYDRLTEGLGYLFLSHAWLVEV